MHQLPLMRPQSFSDRPPRKASTRPWFSAKTAWHQLEQSLYLVWNSWALCWASTALPLFVSISDVSTSHQPTTSGPTCSASLDGSLRRKCHQCSSKTVSTKFGNIQRLFGTFQQPTTQLISRHVALTLLHSPTSRFGGTVQTGRLNQKLNGHSGTFNHGRYQSVLNLLSNQPSSLKQNSTHWNRLDNSIPWMSSQPAFRHYLDSITLPRLELMGVVLGIHCLAFVREHLRCLNLAPTNHLWTDSQCVIGWISSTKVPPVSRLLRVTAWIQRFLMRIHKPQRRQPASLTADEIASARLWWVHHIQHRQFADVLRCLTNKRQHSLIRQLDLFISPDGFLRCGGRFKHAEFPHTAAHPMLLPSDHPFTALIIQDLHQTMQHVGTSHTLSQLRRQYWILHGRQAVKKVLGRCLTCRRYHGQAFRMPRMPDLPPERVTRSPPFSYTGIYYFGPLYCTDQQGEGKVWVALFTCLTIRAVHLELATDLTADQYLQTLRRFIARCGTPKQILSDNAPHFHVTDEMLQSLWSTTVTCDTVQSYLADKGITWRDIPAHAPWMGGIYERLVGMVKSCLRKSLGRAHIRMTQLATLLTEIEAIINTRPLVYVGADDLPLVSLQQTFCSNTPHWGFLMHPTTSTTRTTRHLALGRPQQPPSSTLGGKDRLS